MREAVHGYECSVNIPEPMLKAAIASLETHVQHPGTGALHDPIYALLKGHSGASGDAIALALEAHERHPAAEEIRRLLSGYIDAPAPSLVRVLSRHGGAPNAPPLSEVDRLLTKAGTAQAVLSARVEALEAQVGVLSRLSNAMAAAGALVAIFAIIGWLVALGVFEVSWMEAPVPEDMESAAAGRGTASPSERKLK